MARIPVTTRKFSPNGLYGERFNMVKYKGTEDANAPALLVTAEGVAPDVRSIRCAPIVIHHPQMTNQFPNLACGMNADRAVLRTHHLKAA